MRKITLLLFLVASAFYANAQLAFNQDPLKGTAGQAQIAGIAEDTIRTIPTADYNLTGVSAINAYDVDFTWSWTPTKYGNWTLDATGVTTGCRTVGAPTVVNSFYHWPGAGSVYTTAAPAGDYLLPPQTVSTRRGFVMKITSKDGKVQQANSGYSKLQSWFNLGANMTGGGDPVWFNSVSDMMIYAKSGKSILADRTYQKDSVKTDLTPQSDYGTINANFVKDYPKGLNTVDSAWAVVINKNGGGASGDGALAIYPGIFKNVDLRFAFRSDRQQFTRDITFDILTIDPGNTGKTATYDVIANLTFNTLAPNPERDNTDSLQLGDNGAIVGGYVFNDPVTGQPTQVGRRWKIATYTTGSGTMTIDVNKQTGLKPQDLFNRTIIIALQTKGTDGATDNPSGTYDPIIAIDNIKWGGYANVQLDAAQWAASATPLLPVRAEEPGYGRVWDFSTWSDATLADMAADPTNWTNASATRYANALAIAAGTPIKANGVEVKELKGLTFGALAADRIRVDHDASIAEGSRMILNGSIDLNVPNCKAGEVINITFKTNTSGTARGLTPTNATAVGDNAQSTTTSVTNTYTVTADGTATFKTTAGLQFFKVTASGSGTAIPKINLPLTHVIGGTGTIKVLNAESDINVFDISGQKVATIVKGANSASVHAGIYIVKENGKSAVKVIVK